MDITFPTNPELNMMYVANNDVVYIWLGDRWSSSQAIQELDAAYFVNGEYAASVYDPQIDMMIDGGGA